MRSLLRIGAIGGIVGAVLQVAAGAGFGNLQTTEGTEAFLRDLTRLPSWYWPLTYASFSVGAILWLGAFAALVLSLRGRARALGVLGLIAALVGTAIHLVDSGINVGLASVASRWAAASGVEQADLLLASEVLLDVLHGTWSSVIAFYHGIPFILFGVAVVTSVPFPSWLGWLGMIGGAASLLIGVWMFLGPDLYPAYVPFAVLVSLFTAIVAFYLWRLAATADEEAELRLPA